MLQDQPYAIWVALGLLAAVLGAVWSRMTRNAAERRELDEALSSRDDRSSRDKSQSTTERSPEGGTDR